MDYSPLQDILTARHAAFTSIVRPLSGNFTAKVFWNMSILLVSLIPFTTNTVIA